MIGGELNFYRFCSAVLGAIFAGISVRANENRRKELMAQDRQHMSAGATGDRVSFGEAIPMKKTSVTTYAAIGVGVLAIGGIIAVMASGSDEEAEKKAAAAIAAESKKAKSEGPQLTAKEQQEHLKTTALAFERAKAAADAKKAAEAEKKAAEETARAAAAPAPVAAAPANAPAAAAPKSKSPANDKAAKKQMDSLDSIGSDIASALK